MPEERSFSSILLSSGNVKICWKRGKKAQKDDTKNNSPICNNKPQVIASHIYIYYIYIYYIIIIEQILVLYIYIKIPDLVSVKDPFSTKGDHIRKTRQKPDRSLGQRKNRVAYA